MLKNTELVWQVLNMLDTLREAAVYMQDELEKGNMECLSQLGGDMQSMLDVIHPVTVAFAAELNKQNDQINGVPILKMVKTSSDVACLCLKDSLQRLMENPRVAVHKLEFEFIPLIRLMYSDLYTNGLVYPDSERIKEYIKSDAEEQDRNPYLEESLKRGNFKYDLSIVVLAYNKLEYTKRCVESILQYPPTESSYELILINHGSTDGTKEYFESIHPTKQLDIKINGGGMGAVCYIQEGEFVLMVSNDVLVTEHAIDNMIKCMRSDEKIVRIVPTTTNISNLQTIPIQFQTMDEMFDAAALNNQYDPYRHELRTRLCDPICLKCWQRLPKAESDPIVFKSTIFPDDLASLLIRRKGYKNVLQKDAFCYHFGSVTIKEETNHFDKNIQQDELDFYTLGRRLFKEECGVDPWGTGFCHDYQLIQNLHFNENGHVNVLGVNCGLGGNPLKIKESIKEEKHNLDVTVYNITDDISYQEDLQGVSDELKIIKSQNQLVKAFAGVTFQYIIWEDNFQFNTDVQAILRILMKRLKQGGTLCRHFSNANERTAIKALYPQMEELGDWGLLSSD